MAVAGCAVVGSSPTFDEAEAFLGCRSSLASYTLPKTVLNFQITKDSSQVYFLQPINSDNRIPDNQHTFCLDYLRSPLSSDEVRVFKNKITTATTQDDKTRDATRKVTNISQDSTPFLQLIASRAVDHTAGTIRRFLRAAFILISNKGTFTPARSAVGTGATDVVVADFKVDPFDYQEMARVNQVVRKFGFCFVLEDYTFDRSHQTGTSPGRYCGAPSKTAAQHPPHSAEAIQRLHYLVPKPVDGIFFRPRASYRLSVYVNEDPDGHGVWRPGQITNVNLENIMPIVSVGVDRAIFATRRTGLVFDDGMLTSVCISKGSEILGGIQIPLDVIYGIIALPSETILAAIDDATTAKQLLDARNSLIAAQNNYIKFLNNQAAASTVTGGTKTSLTLGDTPTPKSPDLSNDDPPDAGSIFNTDASIDALTQICAELAAATKTPDLTPGKGPF